MKNTETDFSHWNFDFYDIVKKDDKCAEKLSEIVDKFALNWFLDHCADKVANRVGNEVVKEAWDTLSVSCGYKGAFVEMFEGEHGEGVDIPIDKILDSHGLSGENAEPAKEAWKNLVDAIVEGQRRAGIA